ncbi:MAG: glycosyltransferase, partial [Armatimonadota bacterium]|nr:glycosyltransferase [Armatimonadota bacterium]
MKTESIQSESVQRWAHLYNQTPLCEVPRHFAGISHAPFLREYLATVLRLCPRGGRTCETGIGSGYGAIWLSLRGVQAEGIDYAPALVERARQINNILGGSAAFRVGDIFHFYCENGSRPSEPQSQARRYHVIHHQGVLEHFAVPWIRAALAQQVACADWVVFSVPSVYYPFEPEFGDERLLPLAEWQYVLEPFNVAELKYYGDSALGEQEHILCVLKGQTIDEALLSLMTVPSESYLKGISAIVHTRNEARQLAECLQTLQGWTDEIIVCDMESDDGTVEIARRFTDHIVAHPHIPNFDRARNVSAMRARYRWVFYLDADERVPPGLGSALRELTARPTDVGGESCAGESFEGLLIPFRHHFVGHWMRCLYPGYTAPRLLKNGRFCFNPRLHSGAHVEGRIACFPADNPDLALVHYSYDSLAHYLDKLNRYTEGEAANMQ